MFYNFFSKQRLVYGLAILAIALIANIFCNRYSPLLNAQLEPDPAIFYMTGKALVHGMTPYVDFADVKGPLLPVIYAIGYILTPDKQFGCFVVLTILSAVTLLYIFKTARALNLSKPMALLASGLSMYAIFAPGYGGGRAEDILHPFMAMLICYIVVYLKQSLSDNEPNLTNSLKKAGWACGICVSAALLIKFNNMTPAALASVMIAFNEWKNKRFKSYFSYFVTRFLAGFLILTLPFIIWLSALGCLDDCIDVYFVVNYQSTRGGFLIGTAYDTIFRLYANITQTSNAIPVLACAALLIPGFFNTIKSDLTERLMLLIVLVITYLSNSIYHGSYFIHASAPFFCVAAITIVRYIRPLKGKSLFFIIPVLTFFIISLNGVWKGRCYKRFTEKESEQLQQITAELSKVKNPKIIYHTWLDFGLGMKAGDLPACKYWLVHNGLGDICRNNQKKAIIQRIPDFVICFTRPGSPAPKDPADYSECIEETAFLLENGYHHVASYNIKKMDTIVLFKRNEDY